MRALVTFLVTSVLLGCRPAAGAADVPAIAAASDLSFALEEAAVRFRTSTGRDVKLVFGSSGNFFRQIEQGAPFQMFLAADESLVLKLADMGKTQDRGRIYAIGRIVLFAGNGSPLQLDPQLDGLRSAVASGAVRRFAIANPEHAPYGRAAEQALRKLGLWESLRGKLVLGESVSQAAQFATSGSVDAGIFAYSIALAPRTGTLGKYVLIPAELHDPLRQRMALMKNAGATARAFYHYLEEPAARTIFERYGFIVPKESQE
jgi:molybdate transport system substrate-binding protein